MRQRGRGGFEEARLSPQAERVVVSGLAIGGVALAFQIAADTLNIVFDTDRFPDSSTEGSLSTWLAVCSAFAGAFAALLHALLIDHQRAVLAVVAAGLAFVSLDDALAYHEKIEAYAARHAAGPLADAADIVVLLPALGVLFCGLVAVAISAPRRVAWLLGIGLGCLAISLLLDEVASQLLASTRRSHDLRGLFEEAAKLGGLIVTATGLTTLLIDRLGTPVAARSDSRSSRRPA